LLFAGKILEASALADKDMIGSPRRLPPYQSLGDLTLAFPTRSGFPEYRRELDLDTAIARVTYTTVGAHYTREYFVSAPDRLIVGILTPSKSPVYDVPRRLPYSDDSDSHRTTTKRDANGAVTSYTYDPYGPRYESYAGSR
jgi:alpha-L-fucosidase 2